MQRFLLFLAAGVPLAKGFVQLPTSTYVRQQTRATAVYEVVAGSFPYDILLPFLEEHIQPSDQVLMLGAGTDLPIKLSADGYGTRDTRSFIRVIDSDEELLAAARKMAEADPVCAKNMAKGQLVFEHVQDMTAIGEDCLEQSSIDVVLDNGALDRLLLSGGEEAAGGLIDAAHRAVRLGNPMVCLSTLPDNDLFCAPFSARFGWVQELNGDPGAVSMWFREQKVNIKDKANEFGKLGLRFYVYTNVDNC